MKMFKMLALFCLSAITIAGCAVEPGFDDSDSKVNIEKNRTWKGPNTMLTMQYPATGLVLLEQYKGNNIIVLTVSEDSNLNVQDVLANAKNLEQQLKTQGYPTNVVINLLNDKYSGKFETAGAPVTLKHMDFLEEIADMFGSYDFELGDAYVFKPNGAPNKRIPSAVLENSGSVTEYAQALSPYLTKTGTFEPPKDPPVDPPKDPPTDPVDPPTDPVDPPTDPVDPPTDPVDPPTDPVDPPKDPVDPPNNNGPWTGRTEQLSQVWPNQGTSKSLEDYKGKPIVVLFLSESCGICIRATQTAATGLKAHLASQGMDVNFVIELVTGGYQAKYQYLGFDTYAKNDQFIIGLAREGNSISLGLGDTYYVSPTGEKLKKTNVKSFSSMQAFAADIQAAFK